MANYNFTVRDINIIYWMLVTLIFRNRKIQYPLIQTRLNLQLVLRCFYYLSGNGLSLRSSVNPKFSSITGNHLHFSSHRSHSFRMLCNFIYHNKVTCLNTLPNIILFNTESLWKHNWYGNLMNVKRHRYFSTAYSPFHPIHVNPFSLR